MEGCPQASRPQTSWTEGWQRGLFLTSNASEQCPWVDHTLGFPVAKSCPVVQLYGRQNARLPCSSLSPRVCSNSCPLSQWCHPTISSSIAPFSSCPQSFPASGSFLMSQLFTSSGQSVRASALTSVLQMNIQGWFPLGLADLISLQSMGLSRVFSSTTVWKLQFFSTQPSLWSNSYIHTWLLEKP